MIGKTCGVIIWRGDASSECQLAGDCVCNNGCRVGCFNPARFLNPFFGKEFLGDHDMRFWWRYMYSYAEYLCAECYDDMISEAKVMEQTFRDYDVEGFEEDPEFTKILESL